METIVLSAQARQLKGKKTAQLRRDGQVPAVLYGQGQDNELLSVEAHKFRRVLAEAGQSTIVELQVGDSGKQNVLIHDVAVHPVNGEVTHVDFYRINMNQAIRTEVPLHFVGESSAVYQEEGTLLTNIEEVEVETLPANLPQSIEVDISVLDSFEKTIHVSDVVAPEGVTILDDPEELVAKVEPPRSEEEMAALDEEVGDAVPEGVNEGEEGAEAEGGESAEGGGSEAPAEGDKPEAKADEGGKKEDK